MLHASTHTAQVVAPYIINSGKYFMIEQHKRSSLRINLGFGPRHDVVFSPEVSDISDDVELAGEGG